MFVPPGGYTRLVIDGVTQMTDTPAEQHFNTEAVDGARGDVLILGLGLGMILTAILPKRAVKSVTVVEISPEVIALVKPRLAAIRGFRKLAVVEADAYKYKPRRKYDYTGLILFLLSKRKKRLPSVVS
jgi:spermidine synthase